MSEETNDGERVVVKESGSNGRLIAGAILIVGGLLVSLTGIGVLIGVPLAVLGFGVMFPNFTKVAIILAGMLMFALIYWV